MLLPASVLYSSASTKERDMAQMEGAPSQQKISFNDHVKKRRKERDCLYALYVCLSYFLLLIPLCYILKVSFPVCSQSVAVVAAMRLMKVAWMVSAVAALKYITAT